MKSLLQFAFIGLLAVSNLTAQSLVDSVKTKKSLVVKDYNVEKNLVEKSSTILDINNNQVPNRNISGRSNHTTKIASTATNISKRTNTASDKVQYGRAYNAILKDIISEIENNDIDQIILFEDSLNQVDYN